MTFEEVVMEVWDTPDLMREYRRLWGVTLGEDKRSTLERMIDKSTGYEPPVLDEKEVHEFLRFVRDYIWMPVFGPNGTAYQQT